LGTFNFSAKYLSKKDSSTMLPELTEFVPATRMGIVRKVQDAFFHFFSMCLNGAALTQFKRGLHNLFLPF
jgi:hypothetical protein